MSQSRKVAYLLLTFVVIFFTPYIALYIKCGGIPEGFFHFPATKASPKPGNNVLVIVITTLLFIAFLLLLFIPQLFGFKKPLPYESTVKKVRLPSWFWIGLVLWSTILVLFIGKFSQPKWVMDWALLPLWWGFILMLDGAVYARNGGNSLAKNALAELIAMGVLSISGWLIFEYFNFFIELNWFYPAADLIHHDEFLLYAAVGSSAFIPMAFEWYHLLRTFPLLNHRYKFGRKVQYSARTKIILLLVAFAMLAGLSFSPNSLFYAVWLAPLAIMTIVLNLLGIWTPFSNIKKGDWTALIVFAPVWLLQGLCVECWNRISYRNPHFSDTYNPGYWDYCIPFVNFTHIFNMPLLGYLGYVPFSIYCFMWVIAMSFLMNIKFTFSFSDEFR